MTSRLVRVEVNGVIRERTVSARRTLADFLREDLGLTGTHLGCEHGVCGACTVIVDDEAVRACLMLAVQVHGCRVLTVEGLGDPEHLHPLQEAFSEHHAVQCGFCTPGMLMSVLRFLQHTPQPTDGQIREALSGNLCRCTGYQNVVRAVRSAAVRLATGRGASRA